MADRKTTVNVLGTEYTIEYKPFGSKNMDGYCDYISRYIAIRNDNYEDEDDMIRDMVAMQKKALRHEVVHAFMAESGLQANWKHPYQTGHEETVVDWIAIQGQKIYAAWQSVGAV